MARIRARNTGPERELRKRLWKAGLRYRLHAKTPLGRPDIVFPSSRVAVFVDGCFWHGCPEHYVRPRTSNRFWSEKLRENVLRDSRQTKDLESLGWRVCRVWEHAVFERPEETVARVVAAVSGRKWRPSISWRVVRVVEIDPLTNRERRHLRDLRDGRQRRTVTRIRSTRKWRNRAS